MDAAARYLSIRSSLPTSVRLVAVSKDRSRGEIEEIIAAGANEFGESKVQEAQAKGWVELKAMHPRLLLHMVGHLQRNKVKEAVSLFDVIQSVDSLALAKKISEEAARQKKRIVIYLQFRVSGKESQYGFESEKELEAAAKEIRAMQNEYFKLAGLMGIASIENPREDFKRLKASQRNLGLSVISMGMSQDYKIAVEEGSNLVRLGTAIFGERERKKD